MEELEVNDKSEEAEYEFLSKNLTEKLSKLKKSQDKIDLIKQVFDENPELDIYFANDKDSRCMKDNNRINAGYFEEKEILKAEADESFEIYFSHPRDSHDQKTRVKEEDGKIPAKGFEKDDFKYEKDKDVFECPEGKELIKIGNGSIDKRTGTRKYKYRCRECDECNKRRSCTDDKNGRSVKVTEFFNEINEFREKCNSDTGKRLLAKRKEIVEHPFGTIKHSWGYRQFMQKGKENVSAEFSFIAFIYNFRRVTLLRNYRQQEYPM